MERRGNTEGIERKIIVELCENERRWRGELNTQVIVVVCRQSPKDVYYILLVIYQLSLLRRCFGRELSLTHPTNHAIDIYFVSFESQQSSARTSSHRHTHATAAAGWIDRNEKQLNDEC